MMCIHMLSTWLMCIYICDVIKLHASSFVFCHSLISEKNSVQRGKLVIFLRSTSPSIWRGTPKEDHQFVASLKYAGKYNLIIYK